MITRLKRTTEKRRQKSQRRELNAVLCPLLFCVLCFQNSAHAATDFVKDVRPIFEARCFACHGAEKQKSGLRLDVKVAALKGGDDHAPNIVPGKAKESVLIKYVIGEMEDSWMPPKGERLTAAQVAVLRQWIDEGAVWPDGVDKVIVVDKRDHWSFKPVTRPTPPATSDASWPRNAIDRFILARLEKESLKPSPESNRVNWLRRVYFNLIGLPPTPEQVTAFINDTRADTFERVVDELLASPRYGERWARNWLDVIAFGETHGFEVNTPRPNAWPYRDYVIRAFNTDKPYTDFIKDQLAGDSTGEDAGTGFIVASAALLGGQIGKDTESKLLARQDELNSMVLITSTAFLGLTVNCARCHDHKFDPIAQRDYYAMQAVFAGVHHGERPIKEAESGTRLRAFEEAKHTLAQVESQLVDFEPLAQTGQSRAPVNPKRNVERFEPILAKGLRFTVLETNTLEPCIDELEIYSAGAEPVNIALAKLGTRASASGTFPSNGKHLLENINDGLYGNSRSWISNEPGKGWVQLNFTKDVRIGHVIWGRDRDGVFTDRLATHYVIEVLDAQDAWQTVASSEDRRPLNMVSKKTENTRAISLDKVEQQRFDTLQAERERLSESVKDLSQPPMIFAGRFQAPEMIHKLNRGDPTQPRELVVPGAIAQIEPPFALPADATEVQRRLALAAWIGDARNPLTARVLVNRLWHFHFGEGLVTTPSDFGRNGTRPSNPELLDWLASEFMTNGWSIKKIQRLICLSATYRQCSAPVAESQLRDAGTRLLWRYPPRRMEAEVIRDSMLSICGTLDLRMGGPGFSVFAPNTNYVRVYDPKPEYGPSEWRRMIYQTKVRMAQDSTFGAFDCPDAGLPQPRRPRSTTPLQALNLLNSGFVNQQAGFLAKRLVSESGDDAANQIRRAFQLAFSRSPDADEMKTCAQLIQQHGLHSFCRVILNTNEFIFIP